MAAMQRSQGVSMTTLGLLPKYSDRLLALRLDGKDPAELVFISLDGLQTEYIDNYQMVCDVNKSYDWRLLRGLDVCLLIRASIPNLMDFMLDMCRGIKPGRMYIWDIDTYLGAELYAHPTLETIVLHRDLWEWELDCIAWMPRQNEEFFHGSRQRHQGLPRHSHAHIYNQTVVDAA